jgi:AAA15 family ATPase/GTPase
MLITHVCIKNFKRFGSIEVDLQPLDCLVGPNNSGKTTLLQALALFDFCVHHCLNRKNGDFELKRRTIPPEDFYVLPVSDPMDLWTDRKTQAAGKQKRIEICLTFDRQQKVTATIKLDYNRLALSVDSSDNSREWFGILADYRLAYLPVFSAFLSQEERRTPAVIEGELARGRVHTIIRNLLLDLKEEERIAGLVSTLQNIFPVLKKMRIEFDEVSDRYISVAYQEEGHPKEFDVYSAGSGFQQFLYLFGFIYLRKPSVVLLDEPDVHLHGQLQNALLDELHRLSREGKQILFATHSRDLINRVSPNNIIYLAEESAKRLQVGFDVYDTLDKLGSIEPTQLPIIQAYQRVLIVEDKTDHELLSIFCEKCLGAANWQEIERRLAVCYAKGNPWKQSMHRLREQLQQIIPLGGHTLKAFVLADRDYYPEIDYLKQKFQTEHLEWHIWDRAEIENYILCPSAIIRFLQESGSCPVVEETSFREEFQRLLEASRQPALKNLVNAFDDYRKHKDQKWDPGTLADMASKLLAEKWPQDPFTWADAKDVVLPGIKRWLQEHDWGQFSNRALAETLHPEELPKEVHDLAKKIQVFSGVRIRQRL